MEWTYLCYVCISGMSLSVFCSVAVVLSWALMPRWRTTQNYISVQQIVAGTAYLVCETKVTLSFLLFGDDIWMVCMKCLFIITMCWSLCASLLAYLRLVLRYDKKVSYEMRIATAVTCLAIVLIPGVTNVIIPLIPTYDPWCSTAVGLLANLIVMTIILAIYVSVVVSILCSCKKRTSQTNMSHIACLVGVAVMCDSTILLLTLANYTSWMWMPEWGSNAVIVLFYYRLVLQTVFVLGRRSSRIQWKMYLRKWKNRCLNNIALV